MLAELAQTQIPTSLELTAWMGCAAFLMMFANQVFKLKRNMGESPPPIDTYTTIKECRALHVGQDSRIGKLECEVQAIRDEMKADRENLARAAEQRGRALHERIDKVLEAVAELRGEIKRIVLQ